MKVTLSVLALAVTATSLGSSSATAQQKPAGFPTRPIEVVVFYSAGGGLDVSARVFAQKADELLGHKFTVVNRTGGGGLIGHTYFAKEAKPDGYTITVTTMGNLFNFILDKSTNLTPEEFDPIAFIAFEPYLLVTKGETVPQIVEQAKSKGPKQLRLGTVPGSIGDLVVPLIEKQAGVQFARVPFQGGAPRLLGILNGTVEFAPAFLSEAEQHHKAGTLKFVAVTDTNKHPVLADVPTLPSLGYPVPTATFGATRFIAVPKGVPKEIKDYLEASIGKVLNDPSTQAAFEKTGVKVTYKNAAETKALYTEALETTRKLIEAAN